VTKGTKHDSPILERLLKHMPKGSGELCADSAYLSRKNCNLIAKKGRRPYIKPKKNTMVRARGSQAWRSMLKLYREDREEFDKHYHQRSRVESVYSVLKRVFGNALSSTRRRSQRNELYLRVINYNIGIANMMSIKEMVK